MTSSFHSIFRLSVGDFFAKAISFLVFIYLARTLGVQAYGVLEFALSIFAYLLLFCDSGLELWGTREVARGKEVPYLAARIVATRLIFALVVFLILGLALTFSIFPPFPQLRLLLALFALVLLAQVVDLRWVFMGQEQMHHVAAGLVIAQVFFAAATFAFVRVPSDVLWIPLFQFVSNFAMALYLFCRFAISGRRFHLHLTLKGVRPILIPAFTLGTSRGLALLSYNFDAVLLGFLVSSAAVGWYSAAYRPIAAFLAVSTTFFLGLFPVLSRTYSEDPDAFLQIVTTTLRFASALALPIGVGAIFLAQPLVDLLYGESYRDSVAVLQILAWSAALVVLRGTFRQGLCAAGYERRDLGIAALASGTNVALNLILIPLYGMIGAALATVASELLWLVLAARTFMTCVSRCQLLPMFVTPVLAGIGMAACFLSTQSWSWPLQAIFASVIYFGILLTIRRTSSTF